VILAFRAGVAFDSSGTPLWGGCPLCAAVLYLGVIFTDSHH
jgi:hypothetical protein